MEVQIINYDELPPGGSVVSEFSVILKYQTINFVKLLRSKNGKLYLSFPAKGKQKADGKTEWIPYNIFSKEMEEELKKKILEALQPFLRGNDLSP